LPSFRLRGEDWNDGLFIIAAGVTDRLWSVECLVALWEAYEQRRAGKSGVNMSTLEELQATDQTMTEAHNALRAYVDRKSNGEDRKLHLRLAAELQKATDSYVLAVLGLN
jgi:hypothetical protein